MNRISKVLPVALNRDITIFTHHSLILQIPLAEYGLEDWWMSNFFNIVYRYEVPTFYEYTDFEVFYRNLFDCSRMTFEDARFFNSPEYFEEFIEEGKYIYAWVDNFYVQPSVHYQKRHDIHPVLIYGYDSERKKYFMNGFDVQRSLFTSEVDYADIHTALQKAGEQGVRVNNEDSVMILKPRCYISLSIWRYEYQYMRVLTELFDYICGVGKIDGVYFSLHDNEKTLFSQNHSSFGLNVSESFCEGLRERDLRCFDYRVIHLIAENKKLIAKRIEYFCDKISASGKLRSLASSYAQIAESADAIRRAFMKYSYSETGMKSFYQPPKKEVNVSRLIKLAEDMIANERDLWKQLYPLMIDEYLRHIEMSGFTCVKMEKTFNTDGNDLYYTFSLPAPVEAEGIAAFDIRRGMTGRYVFDDTVSIEITGKDIASNCLVAKLLPANMSVSSVKFYPDVLIKTSDIDTLSLYLCKRAEQHE